MDYAQRGSGNITPCIVLSMSGHTLLSEESTAASNLACIWTEESFGGGNSHSPSDRDKMNAENLSFLLFVPLPAEAQFSPQLGTHHPKGAVQTCLDQTGRMGLLCISYNILLFWTTPSQGRMDVTAIVALCSPLLTIPWNVHYSLLHPCIVYQIHVLYIALPYSSHIL